MPRSVRTEPIVQLLTTGHPVGSCATRVAAGTSAHEDHQRVIPQR